MVGSPDHGALHLAGEPLPGYFTATQARQIMWQAIDQGLIAREKLPALAGLRGDRFGHLIALTLHRDAATAH
ncbi:MAG TPA: hypothetical protein PKO09_05230 [Anaerolineae bacterium]|nr:hypothetical protein [Anaerolineae bacterium]